MSTNKISSFPVLILLGGLTAAGLAGCGSGSTPAQDAASAAATAQAAQAEADRAAELARRAAELAKREEELALKEREQKLAEREAQVAQRESTVTGAKRNGSKPVKATAARPGPVAGTADKPVVATPPPPAVAIVVPAGTQLSVELTSGLSSKTSVVGEAFNARLATDVMVAGRRALAAGTRVTGSVTDVISGSKRIGGIPTLSLRFDGVESPSGRKIGISGMLVQTGQSDNVRDGAKIAGGAAAGAILGHQIKNNDGGKIIGGLLGGAAGALIARKTGAEVDLPAGTVLAIVLDSPFEVSSR